MGQKKRINGKGKSTAAGDNSGTGKKRGSYVCKRCKAPSNTMQQFTDHKIVCDAKKKAQDKAVAKAAAAARAAAAGGAGLN